MGAGELGVLRASPLTEWVTWPNAYSSEPPFPHLNTGGVVVVSTSDGYLEGFARVLSK